MIKNQWYVITGGPSSGKTSLLQVLAEQGHQTFDEMARLVIDEGLAAGKTIQELRADEQAFQEEIFKRKLAFEATLDQNASLFLDRGIQDTLAYFQAYNMELADYMKEPFRQPYYRTVFLLEPLDNFQADYARTEDRIFTLKLTELLHDAYHQAGMTPVRVPVMPLKQRARFILDYIKEGDS